jgi:succinate-semialdehyde dehydrogenase/glutarate-semialdehyde dehydrogenase
MSKLTSINPASGEVIAIYEAHDKPQVEERIALADRTFTEWRQTSFDRRQRLMERAAGILAERKDELALLMTREMGKPITEAESEIEKCAWVCEFYAEKAEEFLAPEPATSDGSEAFVRFDPLGPVLAVMPWNFPFWQVFRFAAPALMAGNVGLLKHASNVPGCAVAIEDVFSDAGFPAGAFTTLLVGSGEVSEIIGDRRIVAATLTGSEPAGRAVAALAGEHLKKTVLELGGSDPFIVLGDADPGSAAASAALGRCINSGQSCIAAKRFIVEESLVEAFEAALVREMEALPVGDPEKREIRIGPLARPDLLDDLHDQVRRSIGAGATCLTGGEPIAGPGSYYPPTVLGRVETGHAVFSEETFGPVAAVVRARDAEHAVELANRSDFGLGASIWTGDPERGKAVAARIEAGCVFINGIVKSDPRLPFGGVKTSGYGRELGAFGIREFVNVKTVWVG